MEFICASIYIHVSIWLSVLMYMCEWPVFKLVRILRSFFSYQGPFLHIYRDNIIIVAWPNLYLYRDGHHLRILIHQRLTTTDFESTLILFRRYLLLVYCFIINNAIFEGGLLIYWAERCCLLCIEVINSRSGHQLLNQDPWPIIGVFLKTGYGIYIDQLKRNLFKLISMRSHQSNTWFAVCGGGLPPIDHH